MIYIKKSLFILIAFTLLSAGCSESQGNQVKSDTIVIPAKKEPLNIIEEQPQKNTQKSSSENSSCDPNYSGCVPIASDVDCADGSGNGPAYVRGPVQVTGSDIYGLDRDGNGIGCE